MQTPHIVTAQDLFWKLQREMYRAIHANTSVYHADHFYNFCITSNALKDRFFNELSIAEKDKHRDRWSASSVMAATSDIGDLIKHTKLKAGSKEKTPRVKKIVPGTMANVDVYIDDSGGPAKLEISEGPALYVEVPGGEVLSLYEFCRTILEYWRSYLAEHGVVLQEQSEQMLQGVRA